MIDEWCATEPGRYIPLTLIPLWDPAGGGQRDRAHGGQGLELASPSRRTSSRSACPPSTTRAGYWDPVLKAAEDCDQVLSIHIGSSSTMYKVSPRTRRSWPTCRMGCIRPAGVHAELDLQRHVPEVPRASRSPSRRARSAGSPGPGAGPAGPRRPRATGSQRASSSPATVEGAHAKKDDRSTCGIDVYQDYREHFYGCFIDDATGLGMLDVVGEDNVMIEMDYPHSDSTWPHSLKLAQERLTRPACAPRSSTRSSGATPRSSTGSRRRSRRRSPGPDRSGGPTAHGPKTASRFVRRFVWTSEQRPTPGRRCAPHACRSQLAL